MKTFVPHALWTLALGLPLACGNAADDSDAATNTTDFGAELDDDRTRTGTLEAAVTTFPGGGTSGAAQPLSAALAPESSAQCDPQPSPTAPASQAEVQTVCFFDPGTPDVPAATIEQVIEVVGNEEWVHVRLTLNPDFVDNTYGDNAIGWGDDGDASEPAGPTEPGDAEEPGGPGGPGGAPDAPEPPAPPAGTDATPPAAPAPGGADAPPARDEAGPPPAPPEAQDRARPRPRPGRGGRGHTFRDLLGSDHAELQLLDANGDLAMHFKIDYLSQSEEASSGFASLGVSGGEGALIVGEPEWVLAATTSLDRNLNACGLGDFTESSPATDALYTPAPDASDWDYRVAYEIWVSAEAFGAAGFGSALIENVHASPSKLASDTVDVQPAPCPADPNVPDAVPQPIPVVLENIR